MQFIGIDLHTNKFTCCYRTEKSSLTDPQDKRTETFDLTDAGLAAFYRTLTPDTYALVEATITTFSFVRLFEHNVKEVVIANTYEPGQISLARRSTDKIDADKLCRIIKTRVISGERTVSPVTIPPKEIQDLRALFSTYRLLKKLLVQIKNRIHSLLKEQLYGFTQEEIFGKKGNDPGLREDPVSGFQVNLLPDQLERNGANIEALKARMLAAAAPFMAWTGILTGMKGSACLPP